MAKAKDLSGQKFNRLTVLYRSGTDPNGAAMWMCLCECGNEICVRGVSLRNGHTKSCGCLQKEAAKEVGSSIKTHGLRHTRLYGIWAGMIQRCENKNRKHYQNYGGRGITVCPEWRNSFEKFYEWSMEHGYSENLTIDRIDNDNGYSPQNCRWVTNTEQQNNTRKNLHIDIEGQIVSPKEASEILGISLNAVYKRNNRTRKRVI